MSRELTSIDLFSGVGGFSTALRGLGISTAMAVEFSEPAVRVYNENHPTVEPTDVYSLDRFPKVDVLTAGFPCQPFSKAGAQCGTADARGQLAGEVLRAVRLSRPYVVLLENVPNLYHRHTAFYRSVVRSLWRLGYSVSPKPVILSPDELPPEYGGTPQHRPRLFIAGTLGGQDRSPLDIAERRDPSVLPWSVDGWFADIRTPRDVPSAALTESETEVINHWDAFYQECRSQGVAIPAPFWYDYAAGIADRPLSPVSASKRWDRNRKFGLDHPDIISGSTGLLSLFPSRRRFEWQAGDLESVWDSFMTLRPSGLRCKRPTTVPAFTAMAQVPIIGPWGRHLTPIEGFALQGMPHYRFPYDADDATLWSLIGNAVHPACVQAVLRALVRRDSTGRVLPRRLVESVMDL